MGCPYDSTFEDAIDQLCLSELAEEGPDCHDAEKIDMIITWVICRIVAVNSNLFHLDILKPKQGMNLANDSLADKFLLIDSNNYNNTTEEFNDDVIATTILLILNRKFHI